MEETLKKMEPLSSESLEKKKQALATNVTSLSVPEIDSAGTSSNVFGENTHFSCVYKSDSLEPFSDPAKVFDCEKKFNKKSLSDSEQFINDDTILPFDSLCSSNAESRTSLHAQFKESCEESHSGERDNTIMREQCADKHHNRDHDADIQATTQHNYTGIQMSVANCNLGIQTALQHSDSRIQSAVQHSDSEIQTSAADCNFGVQTAEQNSSLENKSAEQDSSSENKSAEQDSSSENKSAEQDSSSENKSAEQDSSSENKSAEQDSSSENKSAEQDSSSENQTALQDSDLGTNTLPQFNKSGIQTSAQDSSLGIQTAPQDNDSPIHTDVQVHSVQNNCSEIQTDVQDSDPGSQSDIQDNVSENCTTMKDNSGILTDIHGSIVEIESGTQNVISGIQSDILDSSTKIQSVLQDNSSGIQTDTQDSSTKIQSVLQDNNSGSLCTTGIMDGNSPVRTTIQDTIPEIQSAAQDSVSGIQTALQDSNSGIIETPSQFYEAGIQSAAQDSSLRIQTAPQDIDATAHNDARVHSVKNNCSEIQTDVQDSGSGSQSKIQDDISGNYSIENRDLGVPTAVYDSIVEIESGTQSVISGIQTDTRDSNTNIQSVLQDNNSGSLCTTGIMDGNSPVRTTIQDTIPEIQSAAQDSVSGIQTASQDSNSGIIETPSQFYEAEIQSAAQDSSLRIQTAPQDIDATAHNDARVNSVKNNCSEIQTDVQDSGSGSQSKIQDDISGNYSIENRDLGVPTAVYDSIVEIESGTQSVISGIQTDTRDSNTNIQSVPQDNSEIQTIIQDGNSKTQTTLQDKIQDAIQLSSYEILTDIQDGNSGVQATVAANSSNTLTVAPVSDSESQNTLLEATTAETMHSKDLQKGDNKGKSGELVMKSETSSSISFAVPGAGSGDSVVPQVSDSICMKKSPVYENSSDLSSSGVYLKNTDDAAEKSPLVNYTSNQFEPTVDPRSVESDGHCSPDDKPCTEIKKVLVPSSSPNSSDIDEADDELVQSDQGGEIDSCNSPEMPARKLPKLMIVLERCDDKCEFTGQMSLDSPTSGTSTSDSWGSTSLPENRKRCSNGAFKVNLRLPADYRVPGIDSPEIKESDYPKKSKDKTVEMHGNKEKTRKPRNLRISNLKNPRKTKKTRTYVSLRSFDKTNLRSKAKVASKEMKTDAVNFTSVPGQKKKTTNIKMKYKKPPESPPLDPTPPFVELDWDIVVDESTFELEPAEPITTNLSSFSTRGRKRGARKLNQSKQLSCTQPNSLISPVSDLMQMHLTTAGCDQTHSCCQKTAMLKSDMATQWDDPSAWYNSLNISTTTAMQPGESFPYMQLYKNISHQADNTQTGSTSSGSRTDLALSDDLLPIAVEQVHETQSSVKKSRLRDEFSAHTSSAFPEFFDLTTNDPDKAAVYNSYSSYTSANCRKSGCASHFTTASTSSNKNSRQDVLQNDCDIIIIDDAAPDNPSEQDIVYIE